jgi:hypothetical protein
MFDYITHYYPAEDPPFRNLSDAPEEDIPAILDALAARRLSGSKRVFGRRYVQFRRLTEEKMRRLFVQTGGRPVRKAPHYFILGKSDWFANLYANTRNVRLSLKQLDPDTTSFTYPDSVVSMRLGPAFGLPVDPVRPYHEKVFRLSELDSVVSEYGLPNDAPEEGDAYADYHLKEFERYIEVQVWDDESVAEWLSGAVSTARRIVKSTGRDPDT